MRNRGLSDISKKALICIFLIGATFLSYSQIQNHDFINFDDESSGLYDFSFDGEDVSKKGEVKTCKYVFKTPHAETTFGARISKLFRTSDIAFLAPK